MKKLVSFILSLCLAFSLTVGLAACDSTGKGNDDKGGNNTSETFSTEWTTNAEYHWHKSLTEGSTEVSDKGGHAYTSTLNGDVKTYVCGTCGYSYEETISYADNFAASFAGKTVNVKVTGDGEEATATVKGGSETSRPVIDGSKYFIGDNGEKTGEVTYDLTTIMTTEEPDAFAQFLMSLVSVTGMNVTDAANGMLSMTGVDLSSFTANFDPSIITHYENELLKKVLSNEEGIVYATKTEDGYKLTLNANKTIKLVNNLYDKTILELLDYYVGEGTSEKVNTCISTVLYRTVGDLNDFLKENGIDVVEIYETVYPFIPEEVIAEGQVPDPETLKNLLDFAKDSNTFDLIKSLIPAEEDAPEIEADAIKEMVDDILGSTVFELPEKIMSYVFAANYDFGDDDYNYDDGVDAEENGDEGIVEGGENDGEEGITEGGDDVYGNDDDTFGDDDYTYGDDDYYGETEGFSMPAKEDVLRMLEGVRLEITVSAEGYIVSVEFAANIGSMIGFESERVEITIALA